MIYVTQKQEAPNGTLQELSLQHGRVVFQLYHCKNLYWNVKLLANSSASWAAALSVRDSVSKNRMTSPRASRRSTGISMLLLRTLDRTSSPRCRVSGSGGRTISCRVRCRPCSTGWLKTGCFVYSFCWSKNKWWVSIYVIMSSFLSGLSWLYVCWSERYIRISITR